MNKKAIFINTSAQIAGKFASLVFALISIKLLTNYLGTNGVGEFNTITTFINFFVVLADLGLFSVAVREISKNPEKEQKILSNILVLRIVSALVATALAVTIVFFTKYDNNIKFGTLIASGFILFNLIWSVYDVVLQSRLKMQFSALAEFLGRFISIIALVIIILNEGNFFLIVSTVSLSGLLIFVLKYLFTRKYVAFSAKHDPAIASWIFNLAWPLGIIFIVNNIFFKVDTLILFALKGAAAVGIYSVSYKILEVVLFIAAYFASSLKPVISQNIEHNKPYLGKIIEKSILVLTTLSLPIAFLSILFPKEIILFISNQEFLSGSNALIIISCALPLMFLDILMAEILIANDERKAMTLISVTALGVNLILNFLLIPSFSFIGAAIATLISELVLFIIYVSYTRRVIYYHFDIKSLAKLIAISAIVISAGILIRNLNIYFLVQMILLGLLYALLLNLFSIVKLKSLRSLLSENE